MAGPNGPSGSAASSTATSSRGSRPHHDHLGPLLSHGARLAAPPRRPRPVAGPPARRTGGGADARDRRRQGGAEPGRGGRRRRASACRRRGGVGGPASSPAPTATTRPRPRPCRALSLRSLPSAERRPGSRRGTSPTRSGCCGGSSPSPGPTVSSRPASIPPKGSTRQSPTSADRRRPDRGGQPRPLTLPECARFASHLHPVHQLAFWLQRIMGLRISEAFGILVGDVVDLGDTGLLAVQGQGGRTFAVRDDAWPDRRRPPQEDHQDRGGFSGPRRAAQADGADPRRHRRVPYRPRQR